MEENKIVDDTLAVVMFIGGTDTGKTDRLGEKIWRIPARNFSFIDSTCRDMAFTDDWNWKMWLVDQIESRGYSLAMDKHSHMNRAFFISNETMLPVATGAIDFDKGSALWYCITDFIHWHTTNKH